jgi:hypothetical protein
MEKFKLCRDCTNYCVGLYDDKNMGCCKKRGIDIEISIATFLSCDSFEQKETKKEKIKLFRYTYKEPISGRGHKRDGEIQQTNWTSATWDTYFALSPKTQTRLIILKTEEKEVEVEE